MLLTLKDTGHRGALATILTEHPRYLEGQRKLLVCDDGVTVGSLGDAALEAFVQRRGREILQGEKFAIETYQTADGTALQVFWNPSCLRLRSMSLAVATSPFSWYGLRSLPALKPK